MDKLVIALGGNALQEGKGPATAEAQLDVVNRTAEYIADIIGKGYQVILAHGNGPQVGRIVLQNEAAAAITPAMPFDVCGAMSQGMIGYHMQQGVRRALLQRGIDRTCATVVTQVVVDQADPAFENPTKPIGPFYSEQEAMKLAAERGFSIREDAGRGWRRVVASPKPVEIVELAAVRALVEQGFVVITVGGGGIPVVRDEHGDLAGVAAVIDKDLASERLAEDVSADVLMILTAVEQVCLNYGKPDEKRLSRITVAEAERYIAEGHFAPGSMLPKIEAACAFARSAPGRRAVITSLDQAIGALTGEKGTVIAD